MVGNTSFGFGIRAENLREARYILFLKCSKEEVVLSISSRAEDLREVGYMQNPLSSLGMENGLNCLLFTATVNNEARNRRGT